ncbi:MAG: hypothetical protein M3326_12740, partial [Actinomycetota bacterium]|nr:hypothetical protein [Actinomycetota bacterium]
SSTHRDGWAELVRFPDLGHPTRMCWFGTRTHVSSQRRRALGNFRGDQGDMVERIPRSVRTPESNAPSRRRRTKRGVALLAALAGATVAIGGIAAHDGPADRSSGRPSRAVAPFVTDGGPTVTSGGSADG